MKSEMASSLFATFDGGAWSAAAAGFFGSTTGDGFGSTGAGFGSTTGAPFTCSGFGASGAGRTGPGGLGAGGGGGRGGKRSGSNAWVESPRLMANENADTSARL